MEFKVVLVDDDAIVLYLHKNLLESCTLPSAIQSFKNGKLALDFIASNDHIPFLLLLDINMPVMNGWEFLQALQEKDFKSNIYVAIVTSSIDAYDRTTAKKYPQVIEYLEKPLRKEDCEGLYRKMRILIQKDK